MLDVEIQHRQLVSAQLLKRQPVQLLEQQLGVGSFSRQQCNSSHIAMGTAIYNTTYSLEK